MKRGELVEVVWDDHSHVREWPDPKPEVRWVSVGYLVDQDERVVAIAQSRSDGTHSDVLVIRRPLLLSLRRVRS